MKAFLLLLLPLYAYAADLTCELVKVIDGDTIKCDISGVPEVFGKGINVRFRDCDSPEIRTKDPVEKLMGHIAKNKLRALLTPDKEILLKGVSRGKYFRIVADVYAGGEPVTCQTGLIILSDNH
jgi:endonuclease YncB( thermonuclease family)